jgi:uncharacterized membrane protein HdeD (DUF308 family)
MTSHTMSADAFYGGGASAKTVRGWVIFAGITMLLVGAAAVVYDVTATIASVIAFGWLLLLAGATQIVHAFQVRSWSGFFLYLLDGIIRTVVGTMLVFYPGAGAEAITLLLSLYFIVAGTFRTFASIMLMFPSWGWSVASGLISIALGVMLALQWPGSSAWFVGFAVGVDLMLYGLALLMFVSAVNKLSPSYS